MNIPQELLDNDLVFHFTKPYIAMENILHKNTIRFSSLVNMNDPYEYKILSTGLTSQGRKLKKKTTNEALSLIRHTILYKSKILSLVKSKEKNIEDDYRLVFTKPRLWAQYAKAQYGVCLIFSLQSFLDEFNKSYPHLTVYHNYVEYDLSSGKTTSKTHMKYDSSLTPEKNIRNHVHTNQKDIYFRKYKDFEDENEYRIVLIDWKDSKNNDININIQKIIRGIILGERFHEVYEKLIENLAIKLKVNLYKIRYSASKVFLMNIKARR